MIAAAVDPHPALRATFSRKREKGFTSADETVGAPPLPLAGEGWGEGEPRAASTLTRDQDQAADA